ncbi:MAG TPA: DUF2961 domain-containing protein [Candidatus Kapabacteria bacterium]|nr:DUF2961 domain-containing protein [Candidatus Kapabacteria bacterium]
MKSHFTAFCHLTLLWASTITLLPQQPAPLIPVGEDAYLMWERWPYQRIGARAYMRSTYDRQGGNESADASHFLYQLGTNNSVTLDVAGNGVLYFARYNHWHGSPWRYVVDGSEHIIQESSSANPENPVIGSVFIPERLFPQPLAWTWSTTKGADLSWVPIPFENSFRMGYSRTRYGTGYYIYHLYDRAAQLSRPIKSWDTNAAPNPEVLRFLSRAGTDISPATASESKGSIERLAIGQTQLIVNLTNAPASLRKLSFSIPEEQALAFGRSRLRITWDDREHPSVDAPIALFFGAGTLYNRDGREYLVKALPTYIRYTGGNVELACFFPMPFFKSARVELIAPATNELRNVSWAIKHEPFRNPAHHVGYFHATFRDHAHPEPGKDLVLLDTRETEGGGDWSGNFIGTSWIFSMEANLGTLEGDPRFFFDDSETPQAYGTGTEEWGGGGDYWGGLNMTLPFAGHPVGARNPAEAKSAEDKIQSAYRFLLADLMPFGRNAVIRLEHGGENQSTEHYQTVTYWYGAPRATLVKTDSLKIGDSASEQAHAYHSPEASEPYEITSRYEWGPDTLTSLGQEKPVANPEDYAEFEFEADENTPYFIWLRGANLDGNNLSDAFWMQFDQEIGTVRLGTGHNHPKGFGNWLDAFPANTYAWSSAIPNEPPQSVTFSKSGKHKLRIHPRHGGHALDQIWLSATQKARPADQERRNASTGNIVMSATEATLLRGKIKVADDSQSPATKVLRIDGGMTSAPTVVYPPHTDRGRKTKGTTEFTLKTQSTNLGVLLRRKLDYSFPNQRAEVFVAPGDLASPSDSDFKLAGVWYLAGSNTCIYSDPRGELGPTQHNIQTSNRRFRDDEFLVPRDLTAGRSSIRLRIKFTPVEIPLFPGHPLGELAWSEIRYDAYSYTLTNQDGN